MDQTLVREPHDTLVYREELLSTKFILSACPSPLISRPRLSALLDAGLQHKLTLLSAPAGFGKTTLLSTWAQSDSAGNSHMAWVTLDEGDNAPRRFWAYVLTALDRCEPGTSAQALQRLYAPEESSLEEVLRALINRLAEAMTPWALILDDYQVINEPAIHHQLSYLVEHLPSQVHIMLATRTDPPLPLSRWRARGQMLELRTDQLRANEEEAAALLLQVMGTTLESSLLQEITSRTEGWLAGLRLVGLALHGCADPACMSEGARGSDRYILDYVSEEVLRQQEPAVYTFLLCTSILSQLTAPLCDAVLERTDSQQVLEELERTNVFVMPLDRQRRWYRYHALFAEALRIRVEQLPAEVVHSRPSLGQLSAGKLIKAGKLEPQVTEMVGCTVQTMGRAVRTGAISLVRDEQEHQRSTLLMSSVHMAGRSEDEKAGLELLLLDPLTEREQEVLRLVARGASNSEIAAALVVEVNTVKRHMGNIMSKLQASNRTRAVAQARMLGLLTEVA